MTAYTLRPANKEVLLARKQPLLSATKFAAMLLSKNEFASGLPFYTSCLLKVGLEHFWDEKSEDIVRVGGDEWEVLIPVATTWLLISGKAIYEHCLEDDLYDGWERDTWDLQRWNLWKQQLEHFGKRDDFSAECRSLASQTVTKMAEVEVEHQAGPPSSETWWSVDAMQHELR